MHTIERVPFVIPTGATGTPVKAVRDTAADALVRTATPPLAWFDPKPIYIDQGSEPINFRYRSKWGGLIAQRTPNGLARPAADTVGSKSYPALRVGGDGFDPASGQRNVTGVQYLGNKRLINTDGYAIVWNANMHTSPDANGVATAGILFCTDDALGTQFIVTLDSVGRIQVDHDSAGFIMRTGSGFVGTSRTFALHCRTVSGVRKLAFYIDNSSTPFAEPTVARDYVGTSGRVTMGGQIDPSTGGVINRVWNVGFGDMLFYPGTVSTAELAAVRAHLFAKL
jgi:hypothetical protein